MNRLHQLNRLKKEHFDVLIIGGGITGAGIALDAVSRGLKTALIEKKDFAYGTSSRSTKLIHGGLRYLKQMEFGLVREVGKERAVLHRLAPHLIIPQKMLLPLYEKRGMGSRLTSFGLMIYDWLAGVARDERRIMLGKNKTLNREPLLNPNDIKGGALYVEYRTDDARLTIEVIKSAAMQGAVLANYCKAVSFNYIDRKISGVHATDQFGESFPIRATVVINATGPWVDEIRNQDEAKKEKRIQLSKGVHIVLPRNKLPLSQSIYFNAPDGRMIFGIPRDQTTYIGTTDTAYNGHPDDVLTNSDDVSYLLNAVNQSFNVSPLTTQDVVSDWAGLRPLIYEAGKSMGELSRKDEIFISPTGLISIAGGKLTGFRKMAERVTDLVIKKHFSDRKLKKCHTHSISFSSASWVNTEQVNQYKKIIAAQLVPYKLEKKAEILVAQYGDQTDQIISGLQSDHSDHQINLALAEIKYGIEHEFVVRASDFFIRRSGKLYFEKNSLHGLVQPIIEYMAKHFGWDQNRLKEEVTLMNSVIGQKAW